MSAPKASRAEVVQMSQAVIKHLLDVTIVLDGDQVIVEGGWKMALDSKAITLLAAAFSRLADVIQHTEDHESGK